jgi:hypothetical protein
MRSPHTPTGMPILLLWGTVVLWGGGYRGLQHTASATLFKRCKPLNPFRSSQPPSGCAPGSVPLRPAHPTTQPPNHSTRSSRAPLCWASWRCFAATSTPPSWVRRPRGPWTRRTTGSPSISCFTSGWELLERGGGREDAGRDPGGGGLRFAWWQRNRLSGREEQFIQKKASCSEEQSL